MQDTVTTSYEVEEVHVKEGVATLVRVSKTREEPVFDILAVHGTDGQPIRIDPDRRRPGDILGASVADRSPNATLSRVHRVPRMVRKVVKTHRAAYRKGMQRHRRFDAAEVKSVLDAAGLDCGGYVRGEDGSHNLRPDQMIPILWKAVQDQAAEINEIKARGHR